jgi:hypothetical protein
MMPRAPSPVLRRWICQDRTLYLHFVPSYASSRSAEVPKLEDIRESTWDMYHGKFPQATCRRFRRPTSAPEKVCFR